MNKKTTVVLDTNIFISAILYKGKPLKILQMCTIENKTNISIFPELLAELIGKLKYKFGIQSQTLEKLQHELETNLKYVLPEYTTRICRDADDNKIIDLAVFSNAGFIITKDKDLLDIKTYKGIRILTAVEFLEIEF